MTECPNVLFLVLDTARAKTVHPALRDGTMSNLSQLANEGTSFTQAITTAPWTLPSHASMFTGQYTSEHRTHAGATTFDPEVDPLAVKLHREGYSTLAISGNPWISPEFGFDAGFDKFSMKWDRLWGGVDFSDLTDNSSIREQFQTLLSRISLTELPQTAVNGFYAKFLANRFDDGTRNTTRRAVNWIERNGSDSSPFFFFINYIEPHLEYDPPEEYKERFLSSELRSVAADTNQDQWTYIAGDEKMDESKFQALERLYTAELSYVDEQIGLLYDALETTGILDDTVIVVVGDHGENIGEHGLMDHQYCLYDTLLHVPLIVRYPEVFPQNTEIEEQVEVRDLYLTILELAGIEHSTPATVSDTVLIPSEETISERDAAISEYLTPQPSIKNLRSKVESFSEDAMRFDRALRAIRTNQWKLIEGSDGSIQLYDIVTDSGERNDLSESHSNLVAELQSKLEEKCGQLSYQKSGENVSVSEQNKQRLENLGYL